MGRCSGRHLQRILDDYIEHYNHHRPHRSLQQQPPAPTTPTAATTTTRVRRHQILGGLINEYRTAA